MALEEYRDLNPMQLDALREIGNIGSGTAASALSSMLERPVNIGVPELKVLDYSQVVESLGGPEKVQVGILLSLSGDVTGMMMFLLQENFVQTLLATLVGGAFAEPETCDPEEYKKMRLSIINEIGNIMAASYINALAELTGLTIQLSVPSNCVDMTGAMLSVPASYYANIGDQIILIEDKFDGMGSDAASHILLIPEVAALQRIMESLGLGK